MVHLGGAGAVEVGKAKRSSSHVGVEIALHPTKKESMLRVSRQPIQLRGSVVVRSTMVKDCPRRDSGGSYRMSCLASTHWNGGTSKHRRTVDIAGIRPMLKERVDGPEDEVASRIYHTRRPLSWLQV